MLRLAPVTITFFLLIASLFSYTNHQFFNKSKLTKKSGACLEAEKSRVELVAAVQ